MRRPMAIGCAILLLTAACHVGPAATTAPTASSAAQAPAATGLHPTDPPSPCSGRCSAGTHRSRRLQPSLTYTVSEGWIRVADETTEFTLKFNDARSDDGVYLFRDPVAHSLDCRET